MIEPRLPFLVFLDTEVFRSASFDYASANFRALRERVERGSIALLITDVVRKEVERGIGSLLNQFLQDVKRAADHSGVVACLNDERIRALQNLASEKIERHIVIAKFEMLLSSLHVQLLEPPSTAFEQVFHLYFTGDPPFGSKNKKAEFPDAANFVTLLDHATKTNQTIFVVSGDNDWNRTCQRCKKLVHIEHLSQMIDLAIRAEWKSNDLWSDEELMSYIEAKINTLKPMLERSLAFESTVNMREGDIDDLTINDIICLSFAVTKVQPNRDFVEFSGEFFHEVGYTALVSIEDAEMLNIIEDELEGRKELVARLKLKLPLDSPQDITFEDVSYVDGLSLTIALKY